MTPENKVQFHIAGVVEGYYGHLIGRCGDRPIPKGQILTTVTRFHPRTSLDDFDKPPEIREQFRVNLQVVEIRSYERFIDELGAGMTGRITVVGEGVNAIREDDLIEGVAQ